MNKILLALLTLTTLASLEAKPYHKQWFDKEISNDEYLDTLTGPRPSSTRIYGSDGTTYNIYGY
jgi:hypothetical protein